MADKRSERLLALRKKALRIAKRARERGADAVRLKYLKQAQRLLQARRARREALRHKGGRKTALEWAIDQVGTVEQPKGSNSGPDISRWIRASGGQPGWPWCQYFVNQAMVVGGAPRLNTGYTVAVVQMSKKGIQGLQDIPVDRAQPGDLIYFKFPGVSNELCDHVGMYIGGGRTVEGNTSSGSSGSQNNGGGVYIRKRPRSMMVAAVRPQYQH